MILLIIGNNYPQQPGPQLGPQVGMVERLAPSLPWITTPAVNIWRVFFPWHSGHSG
jgi:hypothetical protein